jgi:DNA-binding GntR family transcriptional regulator
VRGFHPRPRPVTEDKVPSSVVVYDEIWRRIRHGELRPGMSLGETQMGELLGVSRTPVREAFAQLLSRGLLVEGARRQVEVPHIDHARVMELMLLQQALEPTMAGRAAESLTVSDIDVLRLIQIRARRAAHEGNAHGFWDCDDEFHLHIPLATGMHLTGDALLKFRGQLRVALLNDQAMTRSMTRGVLKEHDEIIAALSKADSTMTATAMAAHLEAAHRRASMRTAKR